MNLIGYTVFKRRGTAISEVTLTGFRFIHTKGVRRREDYKFRVKSIRDRMYIPKRGQSVSSEESSETPILHDLTPSIDRVGVEPEIQVMFSQDADPS